MSNEPIPRRAFLKRTGMAGTAVATSFITSAPVPIQAQTAMAHPAACPADLVLKNANVITVDRSFNIARAVAIAGDRVLAVGSDAAMAPHIAAATRVLDLKGKTVTPGIIDGHAHMDREGLKGIYPALGPVHSIRDIQDRIAELARVKPRGEWIVTMPIGDPPYFFDVPDILTEKRSSVRRQGLHCNFSSCDTSQASSALQELLQLSAGRCCRCSQAPVTAKDDPVQGAPV